MVKWKSFTREFVEICNWWWNRILDRHIEINYQLWMIIIENSPTFLLWFHTYFLFYLTQIIFVDDDLEFMLAIWLPIESGINETFFFNCFPSHTSSSLFLCCVSHLASFATIKRRDMNSRSRNFNLIMDIEEVTTGEIRQKEMNS